ncbi:MAG: aminoglycoside phosphotransferase family protein [Terracidiphilus sp.]
MIKDTRATVARQFRIDGKLSAIAAYGSGHINDTYCAVFDQAGVQARFILQRINAAIFKEPAALMENIQRVISHLAAKLAREPDSGRRALTLIPACDGRAWYVDAEGGYWRAYRFIERARAYDAVEFPRQAFQAAKAFGEFQKLLVDLPAPRLHDTIPDFHNTPRRFAAFEQAVAADVANRAVNAREEIGFAFAHQPIVSVLLNSGLPERITHNDTKLNNVLLDNVTGEGICVIDLDTVMPGLALNDFGDMVRTTTSAAMEDEQDLARVTMQFPMFEALARGYLSSAGSFLTKAEKTHLASAGKLLTFEQGIRFLTDYLAGDTYYKVHRDGQNLDRCRTQFKLVESIEQQEEQMGRLISELVDG